jgi:hypothetical protein
VAFLSRAARTAQATAFGSFAAVRLTAVFARVVRPVVFVALLLDR